MYMPGSNARAQAKARELACDVVLFDLEDAVAPGAKEEARRTVAESISAGGYGERELIVRVNGLDTPWGADDLRAVAELPIAGVLYPKVESPEQLAPVCEAIGEMALWVMIETPTGVLNVEQIARQRSVRVLVMGTSDLVADLRARHTDNRHNLRYALQRCVLAARAADIEILDGVHLAYQDADAFLLACEDGRDMGMDGKTLIHPTQIDGANAAFGVSAQDFEKARAVLAAWDEAQAEGRGVAVLDGQLIENLHVAQASRTLALVDAISRLGGKV